MGKTYKNTNKKRIYKCSPKNANVIYKREAVDMYGNRFVKIIKFEPQSPFKPDYYQTVEYKNKKEM